MEDTGFVQFLFMSLPDMFVSCISFESEVLSLIPIFLKRAVYLLIHYLPILNYFSPIGKKYFSNRKNNMPVYITSFPNVTNAGAMIKLLFFFEETCSYLQLFPGLHGICHHFCYLCFVETFKTGQL